MRIDLKRYVTVLLVAVTIDAAAFAVVFGTRPAIDSDGWAFLERQRPVNSSDGSMFLCHDCLNFALFRRGFGAWEPASGRLLQLANLPAFIVAQSYFMNRQWQPTGSSKEHSDAATLILISLSLAQCALLALVLSVRRKPQPVPNSALQPTPTRAA